MIVRSAKKKKLAPTLVSVATQTFSGYTLITGGVTPVITFNGNVANAVISTPAVAQYLASEQQCYPTFGATLYNTGRLSLQCYVGEAEGIRNWLNSIVYPTGWQQNYATRVLGTRVCQVKGVTRTLQLRSVFYSWYMVRFDLTIA